MVETFISDGFYIFSGKCLSFIFIYCVDIFIRLLDRGQLEIVTGGWVMTDEANSHYYSMIQEMLHGHQWLLNNLNYRPR